MTTDRNLDPDILRSIQGACNPVAVSLYLNAVGKALCQRDNTNQIARCPEFRAVLLKLCDMAGIEVEAKEYLKEDVHPFLFEQKEDTP